MDWSKHKTDLADAYGAAMVKDGQAAAICAVADRAVELARLGASGQVAEDVEMARSALGAFYGKAEPHKALDRLAALASDTAASREATAKAWAEAEALRAKVKELELDLRNETARRERNEGALMEERDTAMSEKAGLEALVEQWAAALGLPEDAGYDAAEALKARLDTAESRLAAIQEKVAHQLTMVRKAIATERAIKRPSSARLSEWALVEVALEPLAKVLEGGAPREVKAPDDALLERACEVMHDAYEAAAKTAGWETQERSRKPWTEVPEANKATMLVAVSALLHWALNADAPQKEKVVPACVCSFDNRVPCFATRHPCSPTCTHDDAATPRHPERVKQRSEEVTATLADARPETLESAAAIEEGAESDAYDRGAEAMRVACWEIIQTELRLHGWGPGDGPWTRLKAAIEGAAP